MSVEAPSPVVAVYQCAAGGLDPCKRLERLRNALQAPAAAGADVVICPELFMSGYAVGQDLERRAEAVDGPFGQAVSALARESRKAILYGYPESEGAKRYNAAACFGPEGDLLANHRKLVLPPGFEASYFHTGSGATFFSLGGFRFAVLICYDAEFAETVRAVARQGAQAVLVPTALKQQWASVATRMMPTRAFENGIYLAYANHAGGEGDVRYLGGSCIIGPDGEDVRRAGPAEEVVAASLDADEVRRAQARLPYLRDLDALRRSGGLGLAD